MGKYEDAQSLGFIKEEYEDLMSNTTKMKTMRDELDAENLRISLEAEQLQNRLSELQRAHDDQKEKIVELTTANQQHVVAQEKMRTVHQGQMSKLERDLDENVQEAARLHVILESSIV